MNNIGFRRTHMCAELNEANAGELVNLSGWVQRARDLGGVVFVWLRDREGLVQLVFDEAVCSHEVFELGRALRSEYVVTCTGEVRMRAENAVNPDLPTGRGEVFVRECELLNKSETPPIYIDDKAEENETVRLKYRYLDLRKPSLQRNLRMRAKIASAVEAGLLGMQMQRNGSQFYGGDGIVVKGVENTIRNVCQLARVGMRETDQTIIKLMMNSCV